jgi:hypothetical protein
VSSTEPVVDPATVPADALDSAEWLRANWITAAAVLGLVLQLWWRAGMIARSYFQQGDFPLLYRAAASKLGPAYLLAPANGQLAPGGRAVIWLEARVGIYNWDVASAVTLLMLALAGLALLRLLRTLFGNRPAILVPFGVYLVTPLVVPVLTWWSATLAWLPLHMAMFMALNAHVHYIRTGRLRHAAAAACWLAAGVLFLDKGALSPLLLLALTSAFLLPGSWTASLVAALRGYWRGWLLYVAVISAYLVVAVLQINGSSFTPRPMAAAPALSFASSLVRVGLVPGMLGGPWKWWSTGSYAAAAQMPVLTNLSWVAMAAAVLASVWFRKRAWRAWLILVAWVAIADLVPVLVGWIGTVGTPPFTADLNYLADAVPVIVICAALAFWPVLGDESPNRNGLPSAATRSLITFNAASVIVVSSLWSAHAYEAATTGQAARSYIATARAALRHAPAGADIVSAPVPTAVMSRAFFGDASNTAAVLGPLAPRAASVRWTTSPEGAPPRLMIFDGEGRLWPAVVTGVSTAAPAGAGTCWRMSARDVRIPLQHALYKWPWFAAFGYTGPATTLGLSFSGGWHSVELAAGHDDALAPLFGAGSTVTVRNLGSAQPGCLTYLTVGTLQPWTNGNPVPAQPVSG